MIYIKYSKSDKMAEASELNAPTEMSRKTYTTNYGICVIDVVDLGDNKYEFSTSQGDIEYRGIAVLTQIVVEDFDAYLKYASNFIDCIITCDIWCLKLPIPFSKKYESVNLNRVDYEAQLGVALNEVARYKSEVEELNTNITSLNYFVDLFSNCIGKNLPDTDRTVTVMFRRDRNFVPYINKSSVFCPYIMKAYNLTLDDISVDTGFTSYDTGKYLKLSKFGFDENEEKMNRFNLAGVLNTVLTIKNRSKISNTELRYNRSNRMIYLRVSFDEDHKEERVFCNEITPSVLYINCIAYGDRFGDTTSNEMRKVYYQ